MEQVRQLEIFLDDMGSYRTNFKNWDDAMWEINSARAHDGLRPIDKDYLLRRARKVKIS